ncbi:HD-GYP domain-containing protein [Candidatus Acetothermia bacterium]|nr:HD-GYP domain-containing protein [Candidatus Acetothermia bacterium]
MYFHFSRLAYVYLWIVIVGGACLLIYYFTSLIPPSNDRSFLSALIFFMILAFIAEVYEIELKPGHKTSIGTSIKCAALFLYGIQLSIPVAILGTGFAEILLRWEHLARGFWQFFIRVAFNLSQILISIAVGGIVFDFTGGHAPLSSEVANILPAVLAFLGYVTTNTLLVSGIVSLASGRSLISLLQVKLKNLHFQVASMGSLAILMALLWHLSPWTILFAIVPLALIHFSLNNYARLRQGSAKVIETMVNMLHKRDPYTGQHSRDVANFAEDIAREMRIPEEQIETIRTAAIVHDIGKIAIPEAIVNKPGPLNDDEWRLMKTHTIVGADLISGLEMYSPQAVAIVRYEHEHWDGSGYPDRLKGELIPLGARIVAAADVYDALITDRPYRKAKGLPRAYTPAQALEVISSMKETVLDPKVADACIAVIRRRILAEAQKSTWSSSGHPSSDS